MNTYTISLPQVYPFEEALLQHLKQTVSDHDNYHFERCGSRDVPQCILVRLDPDFILTDPATGQQYCTDGRHIDDAIRKFDSERQDTSSSNTNPK
jgi:hypothetical protein